MIRLDCVARCNLTISGSSLQLNFRRLEKRTAYGIVFKRDRDDAKRARLNAVFRCERIREPLWNTQYCILNAGFCVL